MRKVNKIMVFVTVCLSILIFLLNFVDASSNFPTAGDPVGNLEDGSKKIWTSVTTIIQMLAFGAIIFAGVRYMCASADQKADIKKGRGMLTIGAVLVFAASTVVQFVKSVADEII